MADPKAGASEKKFLGALEVCREVLAYRDKGKFALSPSARFDPGYGYTEPLVARADLRRRRSQDPGRSCSRRVRCAQQRHLLYRPALGWGGILNIDQPSGTTRLQYFDLETRRSTTVARNLGNVYLGLTASPDGRRIFYSRVDSSMDDLMLVENFR